MRHGRSVRESALVELGALVGDPVGVEEYVDGLARRAARTVSPGVQVSITLRRPGTVATVAASDTRAATCDRVQYDAKAGPCLAAIAEGSPVVLAQIGSDERWRGWRDTAAAHGFMSGASVPAEVKGDIAVSLNLYSENPGPWPEAALAYAGLYAQELAQTLRLCLRSAEIACMSSDLRAAITSRATIDQAMGVIMGENRCSAEDAMRILKTASQHRNVKLRDVASAVIAGITGIAPSPPKEFHDEPR